MSDGPGTGTPESAGTEPASAETESATVLSPEQVPPGRRARVLPRWARRRPMVTAAVAVVLVGALVTGIIVATTPSGPPAPRYASPPGQSCGLIRPDHLAEYLPGATGSPQSVVSGVAASLVTIDSCKWSSRSGGTDRTLLADAFVFGSGTPVANAERSYRANLSGADCHCPRVEVSKRPVTGLGDKAEELYVAPRPDANFVDAPNASNPGTTLLVQSSNAFVVLTLDTTVTATGAFAASPPDAAQLNGLVSMARDILDALARPSSVPTAVASVTPEAHYAGRRDPCKLISAATLARYAPGTVLQPVPDTSTGLPQQSECGWGADSTSVSLVLRVSSGVDGAQAAFSANAGSIGSTVTGARWLPDLGDSAVASYTLEPGSDHVVLYVTSGNVELEYSYTVKGSGPLRLDRSDSLAGVITMARDGLAALARPASSQYQREPRYAGSQQACALVRPATLARYGASEPGDSEHGVTNESLCGWGSDAVSISLIVTIDSDPDSAESGYQYSVQDADKPQEGFTFSGARRVSGLGQQAEAVFQTLNGSPSVSLYVWSGNAEVDVTSTDLGFGSPLSRAAKVAADIAVARDVLGRMHRA